jgi:hypothetical protein
LEVDFLRSKDNKADVCTKNLPPKLLVPFSKSIRNGLMNARTRYENIVAAVDRESVNFAQKEDVVNWVRDWMNHGTMIPELSGLVTGSISRPPIQVYHVELDDYGGRGEPG